jgi:hypothetical protein
MDKEQRPMYTVQQIMVAHRISIERLAMVAGVEPVRIHLLLRGGYIRRRHADYVLQGLSILSGKHWTRENVGGLRVYQEHTMRFVPNYAMMQG